MNTFKLTIASPHGNLFSGDVMSISLRGIEGELAVMAGHIPFVTAIQPCDCRLILENGEAKTAHTEGGILTVAKEKVIFLSGRTEFID
jgi:F-type H+-transporting ATPase subunit epsilon